MSTEAKTTKAYKISPELKEKLERLAAESGLDTQEAFIEQLAGLYELQQLKEGNGSGYAKQIEMLQYHLAQPLEMFKSMLNTETAVRLQMTEQHDEKLATLSATIFSQEQEISELRKQTKVQAEEMAHLTKEIEAQTKIGKQLEAAARDKDLLVEQYLEKVDTLSGLVNQYREAAEENKSLKNEVSRITSENEKITSRVTALEGEIKTLDELRIKQVQQAEEQKQEALERLSERKDLEKERELLAVRSEYQTKIEKEREETTDKIRELYEQIDRLRSSNEQKIQEIQKQNDDGKTPPAKK